MNNQGFRKSKKHGAIWIPILLLICIYSFSTVEAKSNDTYAIIQPVVRAENIVSEIEYLQPESVIPEEEYLQYEEEYKQQVFLLLSTCNAISDTLKEQILSLVYLDEDNQIIFRVRDVEVSNSVEILCRISSAETKFVSFDQQVGTVSVVLNRLKINSVYPNAYTGDTIKELVLSEDQYNCTKGGEYNYGNNMFFEDYSITTLEAVLAAINGYDPTNGAVEYVSPYDEINLKASPGRNITAKLGTTEYLGLTEEYLERYSSIPYNPDIFEKDFFLTE